MLPHVGSSCHLFLGITLQPWPGPWPKIVAKSIQLASNYIIVLVKLYKDLIDGETMSVSLKKALKIATLGLPPFLVSDAVPQKKISCTSRSFASAASQDAIAACPFNPQWLGYNMCLSLLFEDTIQKTNLILTDVQRLIG